MCSQIGTKGFGLRCVSANVSSDNGSIPYASSRGDRIDAVAWPTIAAWPKGPGQGTVCQGLNSVHYIKFSSSTSYLFVE